MSVASILLLLVLVALNIGLSDGLKCWHCTSDDKNCGVGVPVSNSKLTSDCSETKGFENATTCLKVAIDSHPRKTIRSNCTTTVRRSGSKQCREYEVNVPALKKFGRSCTPNNVPDDLSRYGIDNVPTQGCAYLTLAFTEMKAEATACLCTEDYCNGAIDRRSTTFVAIAGVVSLLILTFN